MLRSACFAVCLLLPAAMVSAAAAAEKQADSTQTATAELAKLGLTDGDWPWWRGPQRNGWAAAGQSVPHRWSATENVRWKVAVPGRGHGSPTVVGDQVFLATADDEAQVQSVLCFNRTTGKQQWQTAVHRGKFVDGGHRKNSHASSSVACDGERIFINFLNDDAVYTTALNRSGKLLWQTKVADFVIHQGFGSSPAVYGSLVIVSADHKGGGAIVGLDRAAGEVAWKVDRPELPNYTSPMILHAAGRDQVILTGCDLVTSLDPLTGNKLWETTGATTECVTSAVSDGTRVFTTGGYPTNHVSAVAADGSKKLAWENTTRVYVPSLLARDGHLFAVTDAGVAICWKSATGEEVWKHRLSGTFSSSPMLVGDQIIAVNEAGRGFVFAADPQKFQLLGENQLGDEVFASPVVCGDRLYLRVAEQIDGRRQETLYCIGHPEERRDAPAARE